MSMPSSRFLPFVGACLLAALPAQRAGEPSPAAVLPSPVAADSPATHADRVLVKLAEGSGAELVDGVLVSHTGVELAAVRALFAGATAEPLVTALPWCELDRLHDRACAALPPGRGPGHLGLWFRVRTAGAAASAALVAALQREPLVADVYAEPIFYPASADSLPPSTGATVGPCVPDDIPPTTPLYTSLQLAHGPTPDGHGIRTAAGIYGGRGQGMGLRMIEVSWILDHEDVPQLVAANFIGPIPAYDPVASNHGLSGASICTAERNGYGITGVADRVAAKFLSMDLNGGLENAIALAMTNSQPGDVLMMVVMVLVPSLGPGTWLPAEFFQSVFDATLTATANGRFVVAAAGNGSRSLDDPQLLNRFDRSFRDSGAIFAAATAGVTLVRASYSNWGSRIDANAWGEGVVACGYGTLFFPNNDLRQAYTASGTGTSSATPHIAGLVAAMQGAAKKQLGRLLTQAEVLNALHSYGPLTPDSIGRRPDLVAIFSALGILDGLSLAAADTPVGGSLQVLADVPPSTVVGLFGSFTAVDIPLGWNRNLHLDPASAQSLAIFLPGPTTWTLTVPNTLALQGVDVFFQGVRIGPGGTLELTNSCQGSIL